MYSGFYLAVFGVKGRFVPVFYPFFLLFILFIGCQFQGKDSNVLPTTTEEQSKTETLIDMRDLNQQACIDSFLWHNFRLIDIQQIDSSLKIDLKYATTDNFTRQILYEKLKKVYLQHDVALRLSASQHYLKNKHPTYSLLIYDGVRPLSVQQKMWDSLDSIPIHQRTKFVSNPKNHSIHNYGAAVDLTIIDAFGQTLDMGSFYDDIRPIAYPKLESMFLKNGQLTSEQIKNRKLLREVMKNQGFSGISTEWWHFNAYSRAKVKGKYPVLLEEPTCDESVNNLQK